MLLVVALAAVSCSTSSESPPTSRPEVAAQLAALKKNVDDADFVRVGITARDVPSSAAGLLSLHGVGAHPPAFKGTASMRLAGLTGDIEIIATGGQVWAKLPLVPGMNKVDPKTFGAADPAQLLNPDSGLTSLISATTGAAYGERTRAGAELLDTVSGSIPGKVIAEMFYAGDAAADFAVRYGYLPSGQLRTVELTGPFFPPAISSYDVVLDQYGQSVDISPP